jgi:hypothetical protein
MRSTRDCFVVPFSAGTVFGMCGGLLLGTLIGHRIATLTFEAWAHLGHHDDSPRFDLLAQ